MFIAFRTTFVFSLSPTRLWVCPTQTGQIRSPINNSSLAYRLAFDVTVKMRLQYISLGLRVLNLVSLYHILLQF